MTTRRHRIGRWGSYLALGAVTSCLISGCEPTHDPDDAVLSDAEKRVIAQRIDGSATYPAQTKGVGVGLEPDYRARLFAFMLNHIRTRPFEYGIQAQDDQMNPIDVLPLAPTRLDQAITEPGRWLADYQTRTGCICDAEEYGIVPPSMANPEGENMDKLPLVNSACCELGVVNGSVECVSEVVTCQDPRATPPADQQSLLNSGRTSVQYQTYVPLGEEIDPVTLAIALWGVPLGFLSPTIGPVVFPINGGDRDGGAIGSPSSTRSRSPRRVSP